MIDQIHTCSFEGGTILIYNIRKSTAEWLIWFSGKQNLSQRKKDVSRSVRSSQSQAAHTSSKTTTTNKLQSTKNNNHSSSVKTLAKTDEETPGRARFREIYDWCHMPSSFACKHQHIAAVLERAKTAAFTTSSWQERQSQTWINYRSDKAQ